MGLYFFDQYFLLHFATGILAYFWSISLMFWIIIHTLFEITENTPIGIYVINTYFTYWPGGKPYKDAFINNIGDTVAAILGWLCSYKLDLLYKN